MLKKVLRRNEGGQNPEKDYFTMEKLVSNPGLSHIAVLIFSLLRFDFPYPDDLNTCRLVCKSWRGVIDTSLFYWRKRLAFPTRNKWLTTEYWKKFDLAYSSVLNHKVWTEVKDFTLLYEEYLDQEDYYHKCDPLHFHTLKGNDQAVALFNKFYKDLTNKNQLSQ